MAAWNPQKVTAFRDQFEGFLEHVVINSKEIGQAVLSDHVYTAQRMALDGIFNSLSADIHWIDILKSRQLGISTIIRPLSLFWLGMHPGLKGYSILDTSSHMEEARVEILSMVDNLPAKLKFPRVVRQNRYMLQLSNGSMMTFASGGIKATRGGGTLGRGSGVNFCHVSEMCSIDNEEGIEAFLNSLAEDFPDRLYIWESTARGFNHRYDMWVDARNDPDHKACVFIGWWAKDNQRIATSDPDFSKYGVHPPTRKEADKIRQVYEQYGWKITPEQLAWVRRKMDPGMDFNSESADLEADYNIVRVQEQPWTEQEAFQMTGSTFFPPEVLTAQMKTNATNKYERYGMVPGIEFSESRIILAHNERSTELKVWEDPEEDCIYVVSADPAGGSNERSDRSAMQVLKCYADGIEQIAEYAWPLISTEAFARMIACVAGWYGGKTSEVYLIVELNGPGQAVWAALQSLKRQIANGYLRGETATEGGLRDVFRNVRNYIYTRVDSMSAGHTWQWMTTQTLKRRAFERLRDFATNGLLAIRSQATLEEMKAIRRDEDEIRAEGSKKDDRVFALALGVICWEERVRQRMIAQKRTRAQEARKRSRNIRDQTVMFNEHLLTNFFNAKRQQKINAARAAARINSPWRAH